MRYSFDLVGPTAAEVRAWCRANLRHGFRVTDIVPDAISENGFINIGLEIAGQMTIGFGVDGGPKFSAAWKPGHARVNVLIEDVVEAVRFRRRWCGSQSRPGVTGPAASVAQGCASPAGNASFEMSRARRRQPASW